MRIVPFAISVFLAVIPARGKVLELSERFVPLRNEGMWLIKFYAPWCGHCKKLEPIFKLVDQSLAGERDLRVGRVDCTRFPNVGREFGISGYPTILFLKGDNVYQFEGDRTRDEIVAFAQRLMGPAVRTISSTDELLSTVRKREIAFAFIGEPEGRLWSTFEHVATAYQQHEFFFQVPASISEKVTKEREMRVVRVFKDNRSVKYEDDANDDTREARSLSGESDTAGSSPPPGTPTAPSTIANDSLYTWVAQERFPLFVKVTRGKFHNLLSTKKLVVIAVLEENKIGELTPEMEEFRDMLHSVIQRDEDGERKYRVKFQFGYTGTPELANSVAMETLSLPNLIVVNSTTYQHHLPDDDPSQLTPEAIKIFLDEVLDGSAPVYGGSTYTMRLYRAYYEAKSSFIEMWRGNPALTAVLFGLPMGFFSLICYSICCADIMDAEEEDDDGDDLGDYHEKTE